jgi:hypothetical protein
MTTSKLLANMRHQWDQLAAQATAIADTAAAQNRDMNDVERANFGAVQAQIDDLRPRIEQMVSVERSFDSTAELFASVTNSGRQELTRTEAPLHLAQYRTAGEYLYDVFRAFGNNRDHEAYQRVLRTSINGATVADLTGDDIVGIVPEPIVGPIWSNVDARRPLVATFVARNIVAPLMFRPKVAQHGQVGPQGTAGRLGSRNNSGATVDEKKAFVSREMRLARVDIEPTALGGVVDLSLWAEMFSPGLLDIVVSDLADQYAIETEAFAAAELLRAGLVGALPALTTLDAATYNQALFDAAAKVYGDTGRLPTHVAMSVDVWAKTGGLVDGNQRPLFPAINPQNAGGTAAADSFSGGRSGLVQVVSPGLPEDSLVVYAAGGMEAFERRLGVLQAIEPERAGRVVSYSGLFTSIAMDDGVACAIPLPA